MSYDPVLMWAVIVRGLTGITLLVLGVQLLSYLRVAFYDTVKPIKPLFYLFGVLMISLGTVKMLLVLNMYVNAMLWTDMVETLVLFLTLFVVFDMHTRRIAIRASYEEKRGV